ncbi:hypothetical protein QO009_003025 [Brevibacillus aydinogluensis]|jgi:hypothetical protein|uniref:hypothetical protein n=1 Tax=Brevibacillus aydinogluensis TaxID=927786 RepID=UPI0028933A1F|nr:hypothetical protein [Brevibacillus aydinogluensis]MDT3417130.1 hypothetical protein [Brevibacillus aydinogluensis]
MQEEIEYVYKTSWGDNFSFEFSVIKRCGNRLAITFVHPNDLTQTVDFDLEVVKYLKGYETGDISGEDMLGLSHLAVEVYRHYFDEVDHFKEPMVQVIDH